MPPETTPADEAAGAGGRRWAVVAFVIIAIAAGLAYANSFSVPLLLDDWATLSHNPGLRDAWPPWLMLNPPAGTGVTGRPVANISFVLNHAASGLSLPGLH